MSTAPCRYRREVDAGTVRASPGGVDAERQVGTSIHHLSKHRADLLRRAAGQRRGRAGHGTDGSEFLGAVLVVNNSQTHVSDYMSDHRVRQP